MHQVAPTLNADAGQSGHDHWGTRAAQERESALSLLSLLRRGLGDPGNRRDG